MTLRRLSHWLNRSGLNVSLSLVLVVPFLATTVSAVTLVGYFSYRSGQQAVTDLANQLMDETAKRIHERLDTYLHTSQQMVRLNQQALEQGTLDLNNPTQLEQSFFQQVQTISTLTSMQFAAATGSDVFVFRDRLGLASPVNSLLVSTATTSPRDRPFYRTDEQGRRLEIAHTVSNYDPRSRPWYEIAVQAKRQTWTPIYPWQSVPLASLTTVVPIYQNGQLKGVLNSDVLLSDIHLFLHSLNFSPSGQAFIIERSGDLVATSTPEQPFVQNISGEALIRLQATHSQDVITQAAATYLAQQYRNLHTLQGQQHFTFQVQQHQQFMQVTPYQDNEGLDWLVVTVIPESDFMGQIQTNNTRTMVLCAVTLLAAIAVGALIARQISQPILQLSQAGKALAQGSWQSPLSEDIPITELKTLTHAFNQTAEQLQQAFDRITIALEASEEKFTTIFRTSPDPIAITSLEGRFLEANNRMLEFLGYLREEIIGHSALDLKLWVKQEERQHFKDQLETQGCLYNQEIATRTKSGEIKTILVSAEVCQLQGQAAVILALRDITERVQLEAERNQLELVLQTAKAKLDDILNSAHSSSIVSFRFFPDRTWEYEYQSSGCETLFGYTAEEICADKALWMSQVFAADRDTILYPLFEDILTGRNRAIEFRFHHKNGSLRWISATYTSRYEQASDCWIVTGVSIDITERKLTEQSLKESEERLRIALEAAHMGSWDWNIVTNQIIWSESLEQLMGLEPGTFDGQVETVNAMIYPADRQRVLAAITHSIEQGNDYDIEFRFVKPDGTIRWALSKGKVFYDQNGQPIRMAGNDIDITDRKLAEAALQQSEARFQEIAHTINQLFFVRSASTGEFIYVSPAYEQIWGRSCESLYQDPRSWIETIHPDDRDRVEAALQTKLQGNSIRLEYRILRPNSGVRWLSAEVSVIQDATGNPLRFVGLVEDITERKQAELILQQAKEAAEAANLAKSTFLANMSHELRTPLNVILGYAQLLSYDVTLIPEYQDYLRSIHRSGNHLLALINDVLDLSKIEAGRLILDESPFSLFDLLQTLWEMFRLRAELKGVNLNLDLSPNLPQFILADLNKLRQVIINLLNNAVKFTETGTIMLRATVEEHQRECEPESIALHIEVIDTGVGIAPDELSTIFEAFSQGNAGRISTEGTGLGLTISQHFVQLMGGELRASSIQGQGSRFSFWIPVRSVSAPEEMSPVVDRSLVGVLPGQPQYRVLVVDDQPANRQLLVHFLKKVELDVQEASSGAEAIQHWQNWHPHLIWMDIRMNDMTGYEAVEQIRKLEQPENQPAAQEISTSSPSLPLPASPIPIIAITAQADQHDRDRALAAGFTDFITKPFEAGKIFRQLTLHLGLQYRYLDPVSPDELESVTHQKQPLQPAALRIMSAEWIAALHSASLNCSSHEVESLIAQIPPQHNSLAKNLKQLVYNYDFETLMNLSQS